MTPDELKKILDEHQTWLAGEGGKCAYLQRVNLHRANLRRVDLRWANLSGADLQEADLRGANLHWANLSGAYLQEADLSGADMHWAYLQEADMRWANMREATLRWANLSGANLTGADLTGAGLIVLHLPLWTAYVQIDYTRIGCKYYSNSEWLAFTDEEISRMDPEALGWWKQHKPLIEAAISAL